MSHPMMPQPSHDEHCEQLFIRDLKLWLSESAGPEMRGIVDHTASQLGEDASARQLRGALMENDVFRGWTGLRRLSQEMMWNAVGRSIDRQLDALQAKAEIDAPIGSVKLDPEFQVPRHIKALDIHMMPGGYQHDRGGADIRQGALIDRGGAVYMLGRNGGLMNDQRGHTVVQHLYELYPDIQPETILDLGCAIGASTVAVAQNFPEAQVHAIDVGGAMLRYAHARAEHLGARVHFIQADAEHAPFEDESFDFVFSCVLLHETSNAICRGVIAECHRLLKPGGVMIHCEVPGRLNEIGAWSQMQGDFEALYNNEPFWRGMQNLDFTEICRSAGFADPAIGYQLSNSSPSRDAKGGFSDTSSGPFRSWLMVSARK